MSTTFRYGPSETTLTVNFGERHQTIDGFGAANAPQGLDSAKADLFFSTSGGGIGLSIMRLPFASNGAGGSPYFAETTTIYADAALASARGALVWAAPWTAMTASWKDNASLVQGHLLQAHFGDFATFQAGLQASLVSNSGPTLYGMSVVNEPDLTDGQVSYESMQMSASDMVTYIKSNLGPALAALTPRPKLIAPECFNWDNTVTYLSTLLADSACAAYIDIVATHQYAGTVVALSTTKKVWQTEMSDLGVVAGDIANGLVLAARVHSALTTGNVTAWHAWWTRNNQANGLGLIGQSGDDSLTKRLYCLGNWSKFVRPGMVRCGVAGTLSGVSVTAFMNTTSGAFAVVAVNANATATPCYLVLAGLTVTAHVPYVTSATQDLAAQASQPVAGNLIATTLAASSVTSFTGTGT